MDLGFTIEDLVPDLPQEALTVEYVRDLRDADLELADRAATVPSLKRISERHHALARNLALGMHTDIAAGLVGYSTARAQQLQRTPAFQDLIEVYRQDINLEFAEVGEQLKGLSKDALLILRERLEEDPTQFTNNQILEVIKAGADRSGHGPTSTTKQDVSISVSLAERLESARKRTRSQLIDGTATELPDA